MAWRLYDYQNRRGENEIAAWTRGLQKKDRARLNEKLDRLAEHGTGLLPKLLSGPIKGHRHIYELKINGSVALRPLLCKGPEDMDGEFTILYGAFERDNRFDPADAPDRADDNREKLIAGTARRCIHERVAD